MALVDILRIQARVLEAIARSGSPRTSRATSPAFPFNDHDGGAVAMTSEKKESPEPGAVCPDETLQAIRDGDGEALSRQLAAEPALARSRTPEGVSVLLFALYCGQAEVAEMLRGARGTLDLFESAATGEVSELRRELHARPDAFEDRSPDGFTALHLAAFFGKGSAARLLLAAGADVDAEAGGGLRPIHSAAASRQVALVRLLLGAGADPDARQAGGYTALHSAAKHGNLPMAVALLASGADPRVTADDGSDALAFAREAGAEAIEELIRSTVFR